MLEEDLSLIVRTFVAGTALIALGACDKPSAPAPQAAETAAPTPVGLTAGIDRSQRGKPMPDAVFKDAEGEDVTLAEFRGTPVLVNLWASWCAPCVKELPTLVALNQAGKIKVVAVSQDSAAQAKVKAFLAERKLALPALHDPDMKLTDAYQVNVMPTSILYDSAGREVWRYAGDRDWTDAESAKLLGEAR